MYNVKASCVISRLTSRHDGVLQSQAAMLEQRACTVHGAHRPLEFGA